MARLRRLITGFTALFRKHRVEQELDEELQAYLATSADEKMRAGMAREDAIRAARVEIGSLDAVKEHTRDTGWEAGLESVWRDVRYALRTLRRSSAFSIVAVLTLALGIGANAAIFSVANGMLLRTLPVPDPQRLVTISSEMGISHGYKAGLGWSYDMWEAFRQRAETFDGAFAWHGQRLDLAPRGEVEPAQVLFASGDVFHTLGVRALIGRTFTQADDIRGGGAEGPVAVISHRLWQRRFGGADGIVGSRLLVERIPFTIIGVTPPDFFGIEVGEVFDVALPLDTEPLVRGPGALIDSPRALFLTVMLRLKPQQSLESATAALRAMQPDIIGVANLPKWLQEPFVLVPAAAGTTDRSRLRQQYQQPLVMLSVIAAFVLLIACVNLANLLLARAAARRHELSLRIALGASRWRLARQLLLESLLLAGAGGIAGLLFAHWGSRALVGQLSAPADPVVLNLPLDWRVLAFTAAVTFVTGLLFGVLPAVRATRTAPIDALKEPACAPASTWWLQTGSRSARAWTQPGPPRVSSGLVVFQLALSLVLVIAAGLFVRTFERLARVPLGFDGDRVLLVRVDTARVPLDRARRIDFYHHLVATVAALSGVEEAAGSRWTPVAGAGGVGTDARGRLVDADRRVAYNFVTPGWFDTYGTGIRAGRDFVAADTANAPMVAVVNEAFTRRFFPHGAVIGETLERAGPCGEGPGACTVVGVVADALYGPSLRDAAPPTVYVPLAQSAQDAPPVDTTIQIGVRSVAASPAQLAPSVATALTDLEPELTFGFRLLADEVNASLAQERLAAMLSSFFGALALLLAGLGIYGVTSYAVIRRRGEIGIRMALGARPADVLRLMLRQSLVMTTLGVLSGLAVAAALTRYLEGLLFGLTPLDPPTFITVSLIFAGVVALATFVPARRATKVDPVMALRSE